MAPRRIRWLLQAAVAASLIALLLRGADLGGVWERMGRIPPGSFALGLLLALAGLLLQALRWKALLGTLAVSFRECYVFSGLASALSMVSPSSALSDAAAGYWMGKRGGAVPRALTSLLASRLFGVAAGFLLLLAALPSHACLLRDLPAAFSARKLLLLVLLLAPAAGLAALFAARAPQARLDALRRALPSLRPATLAAAAGFSLLVQICQMGVISLGYRAVGAPIAFADVVFFMPLISFLGMAPVSLGGIGVREALGVFFYTLLPGVDREHVLAQAGFVYLVQSVMAVLNLALAAATLGLPGKRGPRRRTPGGSPEGSRGRPLGGPADPRTA